MKIIWEDKIIEIPVNRKICGLHHKNVRPLCIELTSKEIEQIDNRYRFILFNAVRRNGGFIRET